MAASIVFRDGRQNTAIMSGPDRAQQLLAQSGGYAGYGTTQDQAMRLAQAQLAEGMSTAPIRAKSQGIARLANAIMCGWSLGQAQKAGQANAAYLQPGGAGNAPAGGAGSPGLPAQPGALADLQSSTGPVPNLTDQTFNGLQDSDIMGAGPQQGPPQATMAPNNGGGDSGIGVPHPTPV
jgi:hypothetical protein